MKKIIIICLTIFLFIAIAAGAIFYIHKLNHLKEESENKTAHIVFTSDKKYKDYLQVALKSAIVNKSPDSIYDIHILCVELSPEEMNEFKQLETKNVTITPRLETLDSIKDIGVFEVENHVSRADLFKFFFPEIFTELDKILYIDSDVLIVDDLLELYNTNLDNYCLGAVLKYASGYNWHKHFGFYWKRETIYEYNCGIMLYNLQNMKKYKIVEKLIESKNKDTERVLMTQSAFNDVLPVNKIKKLSPFYNVCVRWRPIDFNIHDFKITYAPYLKDINSMEELWEKAVIIHYAGKKKPWNSDDIRFGEEWWKYAKMLNKDIKKLPSPEN